MRKISGVGEVAEKTFEIFIDGVTYLDHEEEDSGVEGNGDFNY